MTETRDQILWEDTKCVQVATMSMLICQTRAWASERDATIGAWIWEPLIFEADEQSSRWSECASRMSFRTGNALGCQKGGLSRTNITFHDNLSEPETVRGRSSTSTPFSDIYSGTITTRASATAAPRNGLV